MLAGFALPWIAILTLFQCALIGVGMLLLGLRFNDGSPLAELMVIVSYSACIVCLFLLLAATFRTVQQLSAFQNVGAMLFSGIGGALVPFEQLPTAVQWIAPITPAYWAMEGHRSVYLEAGSISDVLVPVVVLLAITVVLAVLARIRFRADETKEFFA